MLIVGAKGFAKEVLEICHQNNDTENLAFYDDVNDDVGDLLFDKFLVIHSIEEAKYYFQTFDNRFTIGIGKPELRKKMANKFIAIGGVWSSTISKFAEIGSYDVKISNGVNILSGVRISNGTTIGNGCMIYYNSIITHDVIIQDFVEISPNVTILGNVTIDNGSHIGAGSIILPNRTIGKNVIVGAGAVVVSNLPDNCVAVGVPAKIIKQY